MAVSLKYPSSSVVIFDLSRHIAFALASHSPTEATGWMANMKRYKGVKNNSPEESATA
jgi:hypothetical protein